jgi:hypothetical protein
MSFSEWKRKEHARAMFFECGVKKLTRPEDLLKDVCIRAV